MSTSPARSAEHPEDERHVVEYGASVEELRVLEDDADGAAEVRNLRAAELRDLEVRHLDRPFGWQLVAVEETQQGRLARAAAATQDNELTLLDGERDIAQGRNASGPLPEDLRHVQKPYHGGLPTFYLTA